MRIQNGLVLLVVVLALGVFAAVYAADKDEAPRCDNCGMFMNKSATQVHATFMIDKKEVHHQFVCLDCVYEYSADHYDGALPTKVQVLDFNTFGTDKPVELDASKAWFLYGTSRLAGSMMPFIAAFSTKDAAEAQQEKLGGDLMQFDAVQEKLVKALAGEDGGMEHEHATGSMGDGETVYVCSCTGGCCDNIRESEPGTCPQCGMKLVPEEK